MNQNTLASLSCLAAVIISSAVLAEESAKRETPSEATAASATELSVAPLDHIKYPDDRPEWVTAAPDLDQEDHTWVVVTPPCESVEECEAKLQILIEAASSSYADSFIRQDSGNIPRTDDFHEFSRELIDDQLVTKTYRGEVTQGDSLLYEQAALLTFDPDTQAEVRQSWKNGEVKQRLGALGVLAGGGVALIILGSTCIGAISRRVERRDRNAA